MVHLQRLQLILAVNIAITKAVLAWIAEERTTGRHLRAERMQSYRRAAGKLAMNSGAAVRWIDATHHGQRGGVYVKDVFRIEQWGPALPTLI
jgi:hypothetical protein